MPSPFYTYILNILDLIGFGFNDASSLVGYLMPNPVYSCILDIYIRFVTNNSIKYQSFLYTQLNDQTVLF